MKEKPILFSAPMVQAILRGKKTQTRRVVKGAALDSLNAGIPLSEPEDFCPYGRLAGDRLWVRETWSPDAGKDIYPFPGYWYRASDPLERGGHCRHPKGKLAPDCLPCWEEENGSFRWRPSIHMPRRVSRINLEISEIRLQRLQEISESDSMAEGIVEGKISADEHGPKRLGYMVGPDDGHSILTSTAKESFAMLWNRINEKRGLGWGLNPWVWAVTFKRI